MLIKQNLRNPRLYEILKQLYGKVKVQNQGQPFRYKIIAEPDRSKKLVKVYSGEEYACCCPHCGDTKYRLNVNHTFGTRIEGIEMDYAAHCWNEECDVCKEIYDAVLTGGGTTVAVSSEATTDPISVETMAKESNERFKRLQDLIRVDQLPPLHPGAVYLKGRGFDLDELGQKYQVCFCNDFEPSARLAKARIIFPMFFSVPDERGNYDRLPVGWQARAIPGVSMREDPKYWTSPGCMRSHFLYLFDWARFMNRGLVVVEGPTDALTVGPPCVAALGRRITHSQQSLIVSYWGEGKSEFPIVLIGDPGFESDWQKNKDELANNLGSDRRLILFTPEEDSNSLGRDVIRRRIRDECDKRGLPQPV